MTLSARPSILFLLTSDPRKSHRPAEAIRVAAGVAVWKRADVTVYLGGPAVLALGEWVDDLKDEDNYTRYLPLLAELGRPFFVQAGAPELSELGDTIFPYKAIDEAHLAALAANSSSVLRF